MVLTCIFVCLSASYRDHHDTYTDIIEALAARTAYAIGLHRTEVNASFGAATHNTRCDFFSGLASPAYRDCEQIPLNDCLLILRTGIASGRASASLTSSLAICWVARLLRPTLTVPLNMSRRRSTSIFISWTPVCRSS